MAGPNNRQDRELFYWLALRLAPGVGSIRFARLLRLFKSPEAVFKASAPDLARLPRLPQKTINALTHFDWGRRVEDELKRVRDCGVKIITLNSPEYPARLKEIHDPPPVLWVAGGIRREDLAAVALVGSRGATDYGRETAARLAGDLAEAGVCVVSGMALGIDAAAHRGALAAGGRTIGVLGCGLDIVYPRPNRDLFKRLPQSGALISEFPLGSEPEPGHFPVRNRIISGMSLAVVVVEAAEKSGALITARLALEQNRDVMAVPGRAGSMKSRGTHALLKEGARLVETGRDILDEIRPQLGPRPIDRPRSVAPQPKLTSKAKEVWEAMGEETMHIDQLGRKIGLTPSGLAPVLLDLELKGLIRQLPGMRYIRKSG